MSNKYLFDTHALFFWVTKNEVSEEYIEFFDTLSEKGRLFISSVSLWELALLTKKGRIKVDDIHEWYNDLIHYSKAAIIDPTASDMINSTLLPDIHNDPFDRILIAQAKSYKMKLVTRDKTVIKYDIETYWI